MTIRHRAKELPGSNGCIQVRMSPSSSHKWIASIEMRCPDLPGSSPHLRSSERTLGLLLAKSTSRFVDLLCMLSVFGLGTKNFMRCYIIYAGGQRLYHIDEFEKCAFRSWLGDIVDHLEQPRGIALQVIDHGMESLSESNFSCSYDMSSESMLLKNVLAASMKFHGPKCGPLGIPVAVPTARIRIRKTDLPLSM